MSSFYRFLFWYCSFRKLVFWQCLENRKLFCWDLCFWSVCGGFLDLDKTSLGEPILQWILITLFEVVSSLLQSLYELLESRLLELGAIPNLFFESHLSSLFLAAVLFTLSIAITVVITNYLPIDLWYILFFSFWKCLTVRQWKLCCKVQLLSN